MDYQIVSVILADGLRFQDIVIVGGVISTVPGYSDIPFSEAEIEDIVLTPGKRNIR